jgi:hypothetical protein
MMNRKENGTTQQPPTLPAQARLRTAGKPEPAQRQRERRQQYMRAKLEMPRKRDIKRKPSRDARSIVYHAVYAASFRERTMILESVITCPHCATAKAETMPVDACRIFYACTKCGATLRPKPGDCCVFCSYGSVPCPPIQAERLGVEGNASCCS